MLSCSITVQYILYANPSLAPPPPRLARDFKAWMVETVDEDEECSVSEGRETSAGAPRSTLEERARASGKMMEDSFRELSREESERGVAMVQVEGEEVRKEGRKAARGASGAPKSCVCEITPFLNTSPRSPNAPPTQSPTPSPIRASSKSPPSHPSSPTLESVTRTNTKNGTPLRPSSTNRPSSNSSNGKKRGSKAFFFDLKKRIQTEGDRVARAAVYIKDAIHERPIKIHRSAGGPMKAYLFLQSRPWRVAMLFLRCDEGGFFGGGATRRLRGLTLRCSV